MFTVWHTAVLAAQNQPAPGGMQGLIANFMPMILIFVIMYLLLIRPQQKKAKEHREMLSQLKVGDNIVTNGGIHGTITQVRDRTVLLKIAKNVEIEVARAAIGNRQDQAED